MKSRRYCLGQSSKEENIFLLFKGDLSLEHYLNCVDYVWDAFAEPPVPKIYS